MIAGHGAPGPGRKMCAQQRVLGLRDRWPCAGLLRWGWWQWSGGGSVGEDGGMRNEF